jgi:hypothetical protein
VYGQHDIARLADHIAKFSLGALKEFAQPKEVASR